MNISANYSRSAIKKTIALISLSHYRNSSFENCPQIATENMPKISIFWERMPPDPTNRLQAGYVSC